MFDVAKVINKKRFATTIKKEMNCEKASECRVGEASTDGARSFNGCLKTLGHRVFKFATSGTHRFKLAEHGREEILSLLESDSEEWDRLRSSSPLTGILSDTERKMIFELYSQYGRSKRQ